MTIARQTSQWFLLTFLFLNTKMNAVMKYKTYLVGGAVRDEIMHIPCKDLDYVMLAPSFEAMRDELKNAGYRIFVEKPEFLTIRAQHSGHGAVDFAVARTDGTYSDGRHPDSTGIASDIEQDLARRDFTCNAIAKDIDTGELIDPFDGHRAIVFKELVAVGDANRRFQEDRLRVFRALRFEVQKGFWMDSHLTESILSLKVDDFAAVSTERIREELVKMFKVDSMKTSYLLSHRFPQLGKVVNQRGIWFRPTTEAR